jgi:hypothetical protein
MIRRIVKVVRSGATASSAVGTASTQRLIRIPDRRPICRLKNATESPATAIPIVLAFTAKLIAAGLTL